jgi:hypothetical protein
MSKINLLIVALALAVNYGCGSSGTSNSNTSTNSSGPVEIKVDPNNMPAGLSTTPLPMPANGQLPEGITINGAPPSGRTPTPGIPSAEQLKKGLPPGRTPTPGIPDPETIRKQLGYPPTNFNAPPAGNVMMKSNRKLGGKPQ